LRQGTDTDRQGSVKGGEDRGFRAYTWRVIADLLYVALTLIAFWALAFLVRLIDRRGEF
jgi:hypothetical protein